MRRLKTMIRFTLTLTVMATAGCSFQPSAESGDQKHYDPAVLKENRLMRIFVDRHAGCNILKYAQADLDADGREDLVIIYEAAEEKNEMCVIRNQSPEPIETNSVPAPVSDQMIQFKNIDEKPPLEFILQGRKGTKVGYAIFRIEGGRLVDLFGDGMEDCC